MIKRKQATKEHVQRAGMRAAKRDVSALTNDALKCERAQTSELSAILGHKRRVVLELSNRPRLTGLPIAVTVDGVQLYLRGVGVTSPIVMLNSIEAVWDVKSGGCVWRRARLKALDDHPSGSEQKRDQHDLP